MAPWIRARVELGEWPGCFPQAIPHFNLFPPGQVLSMLRRADVVRGEPSKPSGKVLIRPAALAQATATWRFFVFGMQPIGALLGGLAGSVLGLRATLVLSSAVMLAGTAVAYASPLRTLRELPVQEDDSSDRPAA